MGTLSSDTVQSTAAGNNVGRLNFGQSPESSGGDTTENTIASQGTLAEHALEKDGSKPEGKPPSGRLQYVKSVNDGMQGAQMNKRDDLADLASLEDHIPPAANEKQTEQNDYAELE